jgi:hypothetical protein
MFRKLLHRFRNGQEMGEKTFVTSFRRDSSVGIATGYGMDAPGSIPREQEIFLYSVASRPALGHSQPPIQGAPGRSVKMTIHLQLISRSRIVELYLHSPIRISGVAGTLPFIYMFTFSPEGPLETFVVIYGTISRHVPHDSISTSWRFHTFTEFRECLETICTGSKSSYLSHPNVIYLQLVQRPRDRHVPKATI